MKKIASALCHIVKGMLFIGFSIQIILGLAWMCFNFIDGQKFGAPSGLVYPVLAGILGDAEWVLYLLQLGLASWAAGKFLAPLLPGGIFWKIWGALALVTIPVAMQCHMAVLPYSAVSSLFLLELCFCRRMLGEEGEIVTGAAKGAACILGLWALLPEYGLFGMVPLALTFLVLCLRRRGEGKRVAAGILVAAAFVGILAGVDSLTPEPEGRKVTFEQAFVSRFAWPSLWNDSRSWPPELLEAADSVLWEASYTPSRMESLLFPAIEKAAGEEAGELYREIVRIAWEKNRSRILKEIAWDVMGYGAAPAILRMQLEARAYDSYSGRNYEIMFQNAPVLTKYYVEYGCWWFVAAIGLAVVSSVCGPACGRKKISWQFLLICILSAGVPVLVYTMRGAGMMDYKCTAAIPGLWMAWVLSCMGALHVENESGIEK